MLIVLFLTSLRLFITKAEKYFYIYEWDINNIFIPPTSHDMKRNFYRNCGIGESISGRKANSQDKSFYQHTYETSPYSLFEYSLHRLANSPRRVLSPEKASIFFIPYDITHNTWYAASKPSNKLNNSVNSKPFQSKNVIFDDLRTPAFATKRLYNIISLLNSSSDFQKLNGKNHFVIEDDSPYFEWKHNVQAWKDFHEFCKFCMKITPDVTDELRDKFKSIIIPTTILSAPHPSAIHYNNAVGKPPWDISLNRHNKFIVSTVGTVHKADRKATRIRQILDHQCNKHKHETFLDNSGIETVNVCYVNNLSKNSYRKFKSYDAIEIYRKSVFCLCAPGDLDVRKALFDIISSGCIPVLFNNFTLGEYQNYIPSQEKVSILFNFNGKSIVDDFSTPSFDKHLKFKLKDSIFSSIDVIKHLHDLYVSKPDFIGSIQRNIERLASRIQYNVIDNCSQEIYHGIIHSVNAKKIMEASTTTANSIDAYDVLLEQLFSKLNS